MREATKLFDWWQLLSIIVTTIDITSDTRRGKWPIYPVNACLIDTGPDNIIIVKRLILNGLLLLVNRNWFMYLLCGAFTNVLNTIFFFLGSC